MSITAAMVKELREVSGAGMMDAKKALTENNGDMVAVEVNSETDFVAKNGEFQAMVAGITQAATATSDIDELKAVQMDGKSVEDYVVAKVATIGENMSVRRMARVEGDAVAAYVHNAATEGMGKIGVLVAGSGDAGFLKQVAMHVAATNPASLSSDDLDPALIEREKQVLTEQARESGKPDNVIEKMIIGRMNKYFEEVTLLNQKFVMNPDLTVAKAAEEAGVSINSFARLEVGEGIEKVEEDFAAEVAKTMGG